ncbi:MAG: metal-dependent hydrolase, partial [Jatrophihabitantaceae bacterium]
MRAADLVFVNGAVHTMAESLTTAEAVAVTGSRITAVGTEREIRALAGKGTTIVDLVGGAVLPGINDSHLHAAMLGAYWPHSWLDTMASGNGLPTPRTLATDGDRRAALRRAWDFLLALGVTSYTEPGLGPGARGQHGGSCDEDMLRVYTA